MPDDAQQVTGSPAQDPVEVVTVADAQAMVDAAAASAADAAAAGVAAQVDSSVASHVAALGDGLTAEVRGVAETVAATDAVVLDSAQWDWLQGCMSWSLLLVLCCAVLSAICCGAVVARGVWEGWR